MNDEIYAGSELARAILASSRELRRELPPPRGCPFYGLDHDMSYPIAWLHALSSQGIFRKYEFVLELESGLGGRARWAAHHFGCRVLGVEPERERAAIAAQLGKYSKTLGEAVFCAGKLVALPFRDGVFTHAWWLWPRHREPDRCLREAFRVLRDGGYLAWVVPSDPMACARAERLACEAGFVTTEIRRLEGELEAAWVALAKKRMERMIRSSEPVFARLMARSSHHNGVGSWALLFARRSARQRGT
ncbi:MAG: class I SAM-dependent methyltransferase [Candidatus Binatia bacterium]|nr:class I SAM-dependent methyltransferase [Candidatus Binatia bacterium]